jgi:hypothetical protein
MSTSTRSRLPKVGQEVTLKARVTKIDDSPEGDGADHPQGARLRVPNHALLDGAHRRVSCTLARSKLREMRFVRL